MKRVFILIFAITSLLMSCDSATDNSAANIALIDAYVQAVEDLNYDAMDGFLSEDYMGFGPSHNDSIAKTEAVETWKENVNKLYEKIDYKKSRSIAVTIPDGENAGEWVSNWAALDVTFKDGGETVTIMTNTIYMIENGKIRKSFTFYNEADALEQLGYIFINPDKL